MKEQAKTSSSSKYHPYASNPSDEETVTQAPACVDTFYSRIYSQITSGAQDNLIYSPLSIFIALAMTMTGAKSTTYHELKQALVGNTQLDDDKVHSEVSSLIQSLLCKELKLSNSIYVDQSFPLRKEFTDVLSKFYKGCDDVFSVENVNFKKPEPVRVQINKFVSDCTEKMIPTLLAPGVLKMDTKLALLNVIYFKANWVRQFQVSDTVPNAVFNVFETQSKVAMMNRTKAEEKYGEHSWKCAKNGNSVNFKSLALSYQGKQFSMLFMYQTQANTRQNFKDLEQVLTERVFSSRQGATSVLPTTAAIDDEQSNKKIARISIPKVKMEYQRQLAPDLQALGVQAAFGPSADFSGMSNNANIFVDMVLHKAVIEIDEVGTKAAAATAVVARTKSKKAPEKIIEFVADRPYFIILRHDSTGAILFAGKVVNPVNK